MLLFQVYFSVLVLGDLGGKVNVLTCLYVLFFIIFSLHGLEMLKPVRFFQDFEVIRLGLKFGP